MKQGIILEIDNINAVIMTGDGEFLSVPAKASWQIGETVTISEFDQKLSNRDYKNKHKKGIIKPNRRILAAIVAGLLLFLMPFSLISEADTYVTLDINPSIEFELKDNEVKNIRALNSDGEKLVSQFNSNYSLDSDENSDLYFVTIIILEEAKKMGYLKTNEENIIMVGVSNSNFKSSEYEQFIQDKLNKDNLNAQVVLLNATSNEKKLADEKGISLGRQLLLEKEKAEGILISDEQITNESIKSIFYTIEEEKGKNNSKYNGEINKEIEKPNKYVDTEKNNVEKNSSQEKNAEKNNNGFKEEDKQDEEEKKEKAESKKELTDKKQEEKNENENDEREKAEDKEDQTQQKENNEEKNQDNKKKETNQNKESKENELDNLTDENAQDDETEENDQDNESGDNNQEDQDDQKDQDDHDDHDSIEENDENKNDIN